MNETEKKKLQEAFAIPEPERKNEFIARFRELEQSQRSAPRFPLFMKMASAAISPALSISTEQPTAGTPSPSDRPWKVIHGAGLPDGLTTAAG